MAEDDKKVNLEATATGGLSASASAFLIPSPFSELQDKKNEILDEMDNFEHLGDFLVEKKDEIAFFFLIGKEKLEDLGTELASQEIVRDFNNDEINESAVINELKTKKIYPMLKCYKVISEDEMDKAQNIIDLRGSLAHNPKARYNHEKFSDFESLRSEIEDAMEILETMKSKINDSQRS